MSVKELLLCVKEICTILKYQSLRMEVRVPENGSTSPWEWKYESLRMEVRVPKNESTSPWEWKYESLRIEVRVPENGNIVSLILQNHINKTTLLCFWFVCSIILYLRGSFGRYTFKVDIYNMYMSSFVLSAH